MQCFFPIPEERIEDCKKKNKIKAFKTPQNFIYANFLNSFKTVWNFLNFSFLFLFKAYLSFLWILQFEMKWRHGFNFTSPNCKGRFFCILSVYDSWQMLHQFYIHVSEYMDCWSQNNKDLKNLKIYQITHLFSVLIGWPQISWKLIKKSIRIGFKRYDTSNSTTLLLR